MPDLHFEEPNLAAVYDLFSPPDNRDDFAFYLPLIMSAESVLDLGCGTGALLHLARAQGHAGRLCGLDPAHGMLEQARKRPTTPEIEWVRGDITSQGWANEFDLIVMTGHAFQVLVTDEELRDVLSAVQSALKIGGTFAFETRNPPVREWKYWNTKHSRQVVDESGTTIRARSEVQEPEEGELVHFSIEYSSPRWAEPKVSHSTLRFLPADSLNRFLGEAGLSGEGQFGDWDRSQVTDSSPEIITIARKTES